MSRHPMNWNGNGGGGCCTVLVLVLGWAAVAAVILRVAS
jgi:hypothetical protein